MKIYLSLIIPTILFLTDNPVHSQETAATPTGVTVAPDPAYPPVPPEMETTDGHQYHDCKLKRVEADGVVVTHRLGVAKLMFYAMTDDFKKTYGYDKAAAKQAMAEQEVRNAASDAVASRGVELDKQRAAASIVPVPSAVNLTPAAASAPVAPAKPLIDRAAIQARISGLQQDIADMQRDEAKVIHYGGKDYVTADGNTATHGAYQAKIQQDQAQVAELQALLR